MEYRGLHISTTDDCGDNLGGYYCQVYTDEDMSEEIDDFCIHPSELEKNPDVNYWIKFNIDCYRHYYVEEGIIPDDGLAGVHTDAKQSIDGQHNGGKRENGVMTTTNQKYEITDIPHETYPFLHRIRALRDIGTGVKAGDLGGYVESESNLSFEPGDEAWIFDDAICAGDGCVDKDSEIRSQAIVCDSAYVSHAAKLFGCARAEDNAYIRGAVLDRHARASGNAMVLQNTEPLAAPLLTDSCAVYGTVRGGVQITDHAVVLPGEEIFCDTLDTITIKNRGCAIMRPHDRDRLKPRKDHAEPAKPKRKEVAR